MKWMEFLMEVVVLILELAALELVLASGRYPGRYVKSVSI